MTIEDAPVLVGKLVRLRAMVDRDAIGAARTGLPYPEAIAVGPGSAVQQQFEAAVPSWISARGVPVENIDESEPLRVFVDINGSGPLSSTKKPDNRVWGLFHDSYNPQITTNRPNLFSNPFTNKFRAGQTQRLEYGIGNWIEAGQFDDLDAVFAEFDLWMANVHDNDMNRMLMAFKASGSGPGDLPVQVRFWDYTSNGDGTLNVLESRLLVFADWEPGYRGVSGFGG